MLRSLLSAACLIVLLGSSHAQNCTAEKSDSPSARDRRYAVCFSITLRSCRRMPAMRLARRTSSISRDMAGVAEEASEGVRAAYQNEGWCRKVRRNPGRNRRAQTLAPIFSRCLNASMSKPCWKFKECVRTANHHYSPTDAVIISTLAAPLNDSHKIYQELTFM